MGLLIVLIAAACGLAGSNELEESVARHLMLDEVGRARERTSLLEEIDATKDPLQQALLRAVVAAGEEREQAAERFRALAAEPPEGFDPRALFWGAGLLPISPTRGAWIRAGLARKPELDRNELVLAFDVGVEEARALRLEDGALPIHAELHRRYGATWSAISLALTYRHLGRFEDSDRTLAEAIAAERARGRPAAELWSRRGIGALGCGHVAAGRGYLGRALALGYPDGGLVLAWLDLREGHVAAARRGFRALLRADEPGAWALRGWGLTLLAPVPRATVPNATTPGSRPEGAR